MSPYCPELLLANCPSPQADSLRRAIAVRAAGGETRAHIEADLLATYGDVVRASPPWHGAGLVAWLAPAALVAGAGAWVTYWGRRSARAAGATSSCAPAGVSGAPARATPEEAAVLERLVRRG